MILVVGLGRSGTTTTARILQDRLGVDMGAREGSDHYEDPIARRIHIQINAGRVDAGTGEMFLREHLRGRAIACSVDGPRQACGEPWGIKDPRASLLLPLYHRLAPDLKVVACLRDPVATARSWHRTWPHISLPSAAKEIERRGFAIAAAGARIDLVLRFDEDRDEAELEETLRHALTL